jgi:TolB protein
MKSVRFLVLTSLTCLLALAGSTASEAAFPGTNGRIVFTAGRSIQPTYLGTVRPDGTGRQRLTEGPLYDSGASWSADGQHIVFTRQKGLVPVTPRRWVWMANADGSGATKIGRRNRGEPSLSPNGRRIVFQKGMLYFSDLYVMNLRGRILYKLTSSFGQESGPAWSPDGTTIAFIADDPDTGDSQIWTIPAGGGAPVEITHSTLDKWGVDWSPDGASLAFTAGAQIGIVGSDGTDEHVITNGTDVSFAGPAWSPDGTLIACTRYSGAHRADIWTMAPDGSNLAQVTVTARGENQVDWQPLP